MRLQYPAIKKIICATAAAALIYTPQYALGREYISGCHLAPLSKINEVADYMRGKGHASGTEAEAAHEKVRYCRICCRS